jgi:hypothetical protein
MGGNDASILRSIRAVLQDYVEHFVSTNAYYVASLLFPFIIGVSGLLSDPQLRWGARAISIPVLLVALAHGYRIGRPFGIIISCTPTHLVNGDRAPDKPSERRGNILIQDDSTKVHGEMELTRFNGSFDVRFDSSSEIGVELETTPRREHSYDPEMNRLSCRDVSERQFPIKLDVYPKGSVENAGRYHSLTVRDHDTGHSLTQFQVIDVRS